MAIFKVGNIDYSNRVIAGSYNVQTKPVYTSWNDADGEEIPFEVIAWKRIPEPYKERD